MTSNPVLPSINNTIPDQSHHPLKALSKSIARISQPLTLAQIFQTTATEVRQLLNADRVAVFRFDPATDWEGEFVSEDVAAGWNSVLAERVYDHCFGKQFAAQYQQGRGQAVADIHAADLSDCHASILDQFQVRANLVVPILQGAQLWGLLCIHQCAEARQWREDDIEFVRCIAEHLSLTLKHIASLSAVYYQVKQQKALTGVINRIRESLDLDTIFQTTVNEVRQLLQVDRAGIFQFYPEQGWEGGFVAEDHAEGLSSAIAERVRDHCFGENYATLYQQGRMYVSANIYESGLQSCHVQILERFQVKANVVVPLVKGDDLWGLLCIHQCRSTRHWKDSEIEFIRQIGEQLSVALTQEGQVNQLQLQAAQLADAASRESALERQKLLSATIDKIRQSLEIQEIFKTTTHESRQLLAAERVAIYQFNPDWSGDFIAESMAEGWLPLVGVQPTVKDTHLMETQGGRYTNCETFVSDDIYQSGHQDCHIALLEEFQARAYAIAPIMVGNRLWGLLAAYQNSAPRHWETEEIELLAQLGTQFGIALNQAESMAQVQQQATALQKATQRQKALSHTIDKIRQSLDIDTIFTTTTQEVRQLLDVERVAIYRFNTDWSGDFVADSIVDGWQPTRPAQGMIADRFSKVNQDGQLPRNEVFVPISQGEQLWGLLMAYQTSTPRYWEEEEVRLLAQVGAQLGIAVHQAELLKQKQQQAEQLNQTLNDLQRTQAQLIQGEKMAGLGHLMAGIAHEINNPVSFIFGNVTPAQEYITDLLDLLRLYQQQYPEPTEAIQTKVDDIDLDFLADDLPKLINSMQMGASRIKEIVQSMRVFSRMDEAACKAVDLHQGIDSTLLILGHRLKAQDQRPAIEVEKSYDDLPLVNCYAGPLNQVFMNLLSNAIDALGEALPSGRFPQIQILTNWLREHDSVVIQIRDNGLGIPESILNNVFNPFFTTKPVGKGTGLGLSISHQVVTEIHQGKLECFSQPMAGTTFRIEIPINSGKVALGSV
ncbi:MAG: GAF domain-containing protein [Cyanobacteria bacterium J06642_9]